MSDPSNAFGNYPSMPTEPPQAPLVAGPPPPPVVNAVKLMLARAALGLLSLLVVVGTKGSLEDQILKSNPTFDAAKVQTAASVAITVGIVIGLIFIALYVWLALQVRKGKRWARTVTLVLAGFAVVSGLLSLTQPSPGLSRLFGLVTVVLDIAVIALLMSRPSAEYFRRRF